MPVEQGDAPVTTRDDAEGRLQDAFQSTNANPPDAAQKEDVERVWRAVSGELPTAERRDLVDRLASEPALAHAWRVAHELRDAQQDEGLLEGQRSPRSWTPAWIGLVAVLLLSVAVGVMQLRRVPADTMRDSGRPVIESLLPFDATLPRGAFVLRWKPGPEGSRYQVRVTTEDLRVLTSAADLTTPELTVPPDRLSGLPPNARVLWQVVAALPGGETVSSQTFVVRAP